jgi:hypothetical protein
LNRPINLLQERQLIPPEGVTPPKINLPNEFKKTNCSAEYVLRFLLSLCVLRFLFLYRIFRSTMNAIPNTQSLLNKSRLPLGILIHPFKDLAVSFESNCNRVVRNRNSNHLPEPEIPRALFRRNRNGTDRITNWDMRLSWNLHALVL